VPFTPSKTLPTRSAQRLDGVRALVKHMVEGQLVHAATRLRRSIIIHANGLVGGGDVRRAVTATSTARAFSTTNMTDTIPPPPPRPRGGGCWFTTLRKQTNKSSSQKRRGSRKIRSKQVCTGRKAIALPRKYGRGTINLCTHRRTYVP
jgi:hypothetical protein